ncbi:hypothetical protein PROFUN_11508 [Planoprotostelium fungivorum]|uniref:Uncharacterized protein n=1 Tax=Planoprotostelium fungivorum TaxID=1890364 RepID=A0A2P6N9Y6_9EUKA|nr:hypothetical protein PROFUN_11508 [Planoprotostelium fungivorum]
MKHVFVSDDQGNPVYFDHPRGRMFCGPLSLTPIAMQENLGERVTSISTPLFDIVMEWHEQIALTITSDEGEPESVLRNELRFIYEIITMIVGPKVLQEKIRPNLFSRNQKLLQKIIDTALHMCRTQQSFLVKAIENLELNHDLHLKISNNVKKSLDRLPNALHGLLFVRTKLITIYSKPKAFALDSTDILLLITLFKGHFDPKSRKFEEEKMPVSDYSSPAPIAHVNEDDYTSTEDDEGGKRMSVATLLREEETSELIDQILNLMDGLEAVHTNNEIALTLFMRFLEFLIETTGDGSPSGVHNQLQQFNRMLSQGITIGPSTSFVPYRASAMISMKQYAASIYDPEDIKILQQLLLTSNHYELVVDGQPSTELVRSLADFARDNGFQWTNKEHVPPDLVRMLMKAIAINDPLDLSKPVSHQKSVIFQRGNARKMTVKREEPVVEQLPTFLKPEAVYQQIYLRNPLLYNHYWVYCTALDATHTLLVINNNSTGTAEEKASLSVIDGVLAKELSLEMSFTATKEQAHLSAIPFIHQYPGMVHFIFIDRSTNRVTAPTIGAVHGMQLDQSDDVTQNTKKIIEDQVWQLCHHAHKHLSSGYYSMLMKNGPFQYSYRLLLEDPEGFEIPLDQGPHNLGTSGPPICNSIYRDLMRKYKGSRCYELYTLYLGVVSVNMVALHDKAIMNQLKKSDERE